MNTTADGERPSAFSVEVGQRLRAVRRSRRLSLDDVERRSGGQWSASAVGAYERGFRNLSLPRLRELALFYDVPMSLLLGEQLDAEHFARAGNGLIVDLEALGRAPDAAPIMRYLQTIIVERGDFNGKVLSVRRDDVRALCVICQCSEADLFAMFGRWGALLGGRPETETGR